MKIAVGCRKLYASGGGVSLVAVDQAGGDGMGSSVPKLTAVPTRHGGRRGHNVRWGSIGRTTARVLANRLPQAR